MESGVLVVCAGGGGIPVRMSGDGLVHGVEAVVDKDLSAALLAERLGADALVLLTDVAGVVRDFGTPQAQLVEHLDAQEARALALPAGSMGPKVEAACRFAQATGGHAAIGALADAAALVAGTAGTRIARAPLVAVQAPNAAEPARS